FEIAACAELLGKLMPSASIAEAMVFAVYIPPQEPGPGIAQDSTCSSSPSEIFPLEWAPTASKIETISMFRSPMQPGRIVPPYTNTDGRFNRAKAIRQPGMFLSQPPMATSPSNPSHPATVSIESAITSLETREYFIPSVPIEMPSETVMVLKMIDFPPASSTPFPDSRASRSIWTLHGVTMLQVEATPMIVF